MSDKAEINTDREMLANPLWGEALCILYGMMNLGVCFRVQTMSSLLKENYIKRKKRVERKLVNDGVDKTVELSLEVEK